MSTSTTTVWQWPSDVLEFAEKHEVTPCLEPLREATLRIFPMARSLRVFLEDDPEIRDDWHILFAVDLPQMTVTDLVAAQNRWNGELFRVCPKPLVCIFRLSMEPGQP